MMHVKGRGEENHDITIFPISDSMLRFLETSITENLLGAMTQIQPPWSNQIKYKIKTGGFAIPIHRG